MKEKEPKKGKKWHEAKHSFIMKNFIIGALHQILLG
jgi:hypothetical protein